ncbi:hypothetical protein [Facklamia hominis]
MKRHETPPLYLNEAGYAKIVTTSPLTKRGRPSRVYQILFHEIPN